jgi:peptide/nickel transport system substrate-binding protein
LDDIKPNPKNNAANGDTDDTPRKPDAGTTPDAGTDTAADADSSADEARSAAAADTKVTTDAPKQSSRKALIAALIVVLLAGLGAAAYFLLAGNTAKNSTATSKSAKKDIPNIRYATRTHGWDAFYPVSDASSTYMESNAAVFEGLVRYENKTQIVPLLATGWTNPDTSSWTFTLKKGVKFHTGREMTAEDVKLSFEAAADTIWGETFGNSIKSVEVKSPYQVTIKTDGPDPTLLKKLVNLFVFDTKSGKTGDPVNGTGPFVLKPGTKAGDTSLELVAFDKYHGGHVYVRSLSFIGYDEDDGGKMFNDHKADITDVPPTAVTREHKLLTVEPNAVFLLPLNTKRANSPLANLKVRQAMYLASDPLPIGKIRAEDPLPASQLIPSTIPGYNPDVTRPSRDVAKAKALLKEAGYPNGITINFTYYGPSQSTADEITRQMAEAGIKLKQDPQADVRSLGQKAGSGGTDMFFQTYSSDILDASDVLSAFADTNNYTNQKAVDLIAQAQNTFDSSKRLGLLQQATKEMADDLGVLPMYSPKTTPISYDPSYVMQRDNNSSTILGIYWSKVYAK